MSPKTPKAAAGGARGAPDRERAVVRPGWVLAAVLGLLFAVMGAAVQDPDPMPGRQERTWLQWFRYPLEQRAMLRLPGAPATMLGVHMEGANVWVVGRGGSIMQSADGGKTWNSPASVAYGELFDVTFAPGNSKKGWAVGSRGVILATEDGKVWQPQPVIGADDEPLRVGDLRTVFALDEKRLWIASVGDQALRSVDGGKHWQRQEISKAKVSLRDIRFDRDGQHGWALGGSTAFWTETADGPWQPALGVPTGDTLWNVRFADDKQRGWLTTAKNGVLSSSDGGRTWQPSMSLCFHEDGKHGLMTVPGGHVLATNDGGETWVEGQQMERDCGQKPQPAGVQPEMKPVDLRGLEVSGDGSRLWVTDAIGGIWYSSNGGQRWKKAETSTTTLLRSIVMDGEGKTGWAVGADGVILSSDDFGTKWADRTSGADAVALAAHGSADGMHLWVAGHSGILLASADGGRNWARQGAEVLGDSDLYDVTFDKNNKRGWVVTGDGRVVSTEDGGLTWKRSERLMQARLRSVHASADGRRLWVAGEDDVLLTSPNGGDSWTPVDLPKHPDGRTFYFRVLFLNETLGWVVGGRGTLLKTIDGGSNWERVTLTPKARAQHDAPAKPVSAALRSIHFQHKGQYGWLVGDGGTLWATDDGGKTWAGQESGTPASLLAARFSEDGRTGFAAGEGGVILYTNNGGTLWQQANSVGSARTALVMAENGKTGWAVGYPPALLQTDNHGKDWMPKDWPLHYARYPAPWFWLVLLLVGGAMWQALRPAREPAIEGAAAMGTTDAPTEEFANDKLEFTPLARGISRFLRNTRTEPPLTMAISGDWGSGKSSLLALVCADLRRYGSRPVWFNAWHHQNEEQLIAALLTGIRDRGLPPLLTPDGCVFRLRLLWLRSRKHFLYTLAVLLAISALAGFLIRSGPGEWTGLGHAFSVTAQWLEAAFSKGGDTSKLPGGGLGQAAGSLLGQLTALATIAFGLLKAMRAFGADPAVLATKAASNFRMKDASAQTSFRARYAEQFNEVTEALPYRLVIVIDDLDRCKPEAVLSVMEAVNFLVTSGRCFVLFGMATPRVEAALSLAFERIAKELVELDPTLPPDPPKEQMERVERERRRAYVRDYLEKLINLEITVPPSAKLQRENLLVAVAQSRSGAVAAMSRQALALWPLWVGAAAVVAGVTMGMNLRLSSGDGTERSVAESASAPERTAASKKERKGDSDDVGQLRAEASASAPVVQSANNTKRAAFEIKGYERAARIWPLATSFVLLALAAGGLLIYRVRTSLSHVEDAPEFTQALKVWLPVVAASRRPTPRAIKRFGNRLRYLAMLQHDDSPDPSPLEELRTRWERLLSRDEPAPTRSAKTPAAEGEPLQEHILVALGALHAVFGAGWRDRLPAEPAAATRRAGAPRQAHSGGPRPADPAPPTQATADLPPSQGSAQPGPAKPAPSAIDEGLMQAVDEAIASYKTTGMRWPPTQQELALFERALSGLPQSRATEAVRGAA